MVKKSFLIQIVTSNTKDQYYYADFTNKGTEVPSHLLVQCPKVLFTFTVWFLTLAVHTDNLCSTPSDFDRIGLGDCQLLGFLNAL